MRVSRCPIAFAITAMGTPLIVFSGGDPRTPVAVLVLTLSLVACARSSSPSAGSTGIFGTVVAAPTCPVERADSPCPPTPWSGTVRATAGNGASYQAATDSQGNYSLSLPPGTYEVVPVTDTALPRGVPTTATVADGQMQRLDLRLDTGIR